MPPKPAGIFRNFLSIYRVNPYHYGKLTVNRLTGVLFRLTGVLFRLTGVLFRLTGAMLFSLNYKNVSTAGHCVCWEKVLLCTSIYFDVLLFRFLLCVFKESHTSIKLSKKKEKENSDEISISGVNCLSLLDRNIHHR